MCLIKQVNGRILFTNLEHDIQIDYVVMVKPEVTLEEAKEYLGDDYVYTLSKPKRINDNDPNLIVYVSNNLKQLNIKGSHKIFNISIISVTGQVVRCLGNINQNTCIIDISGLKSGIYIANVDNRPCKIFID
jgi:hypothetical protein